MAFAQRRALAAVPNLAFIAEADDHLTHIERRLATR